MLFPSAFAVPGRADISQDITPPSITGGHASLCSKYVFSSFTSFPTLTYVSTVFLASGTTFKSKKYFDSAFTVSFLPFTVNV